MNVHLVAGCIAIALSVIATPVSAQNRYRVANPVIDPPTTGSIDRSYSATRTTSPVIRMIYVESSAKGGNAELTNHLVPHYGDTAGGPAR